MEKIKELLGNAEKILFSDSHIPRNNEFFTEWLMKVIDYSKAKVYGLGDVFELIECKEDEVRKKGIIEIGLLRKLKQLNRLFLLRGNHDMESGKVFGLPSYTDSDRDYISVNETTFCILHGHQFDPICKHVWLYKFFSWLIPYFVTPGKAKYGQKQKIYDITVKKVLNNAYKANKNLIFGHTHWCGIIKRESGHVIFQLGDMLDSCTSLIIDKEGKFYLLKKWEIIAEWP